MPSEVVTDPNDPLVRRLNAWFAVDAVDDGEVEAFGKVKGFELVGLIGLMSGVAAVLSV